MTLGRRKGRYDAIPELLERIRAEFCPEWLHCLILSLQMVGKLTKTKKVP